jgi:flagellar biosynthesis protein FliP
MCPKKRAPRIVTGNTRRIGFLLLLPFLIIDLVVASNLMSTGRMMLPRLVVSCPSS